MRQAGILLAVEDTARSAAFYEAVLGLGIKADCGAHLVLEGGLFLQSKASWTHILDVPPQKIVCENNSCELYFETEDMDAFYSKLCAYGDVRLLTDLSMQPWGQKVVRFYDLDGHIMEVGESIIGIVRRKHSQGLAPADIAAEMDVPLGYVQEMLQSE